MSPQELENEILKELHAWANDLKFMNELWPNKEAEKNTCPVCGIQPLLLEEFIKSTISKTRTSVLDEAIEYMEHTSNCIRSQFSAGEPTEDGDYRQKFAGKWYKASPVDETPKCDCGLDDLINKYK